MFVLYTLGEKIGLKARQTLHLLEPFSPLPCINVNTFDGEEKLQKSLLLYNSAAGSRGAQAGCKIKMIISKVEFKFSKILFDNF